MITDDWIGDDYWIDYYRRKSQECAAELETAKREIDRLRGLIRDIHHDRESIRHFENRILWHCQSAIREQK